ncbi:MAG: 23S rRNA (pseudouridine(1915)-N(3))-methyltransferase RlmH [Solirubrobacterales bacterium]
MKVTLLAVGRIKAPFADAQRHYLKMLAPRLRVEVVEVRESDRLESRLDAGARLVCLDGRGSMLDSLEWSGWLDARRLEARDVLIAIGGPTGLPDEVLDRADEVLSLGPQTIAHQLARIVLLEQLFRASKILAGEPYHL